ncbi:MAG TPA: hypothetical protein PLB05_09040 [Candidatus Omnitrophota bacterium]|nr:hypothetical protein [Candidatus Omnitrophota bacterium]HPN56341.1 hypothetical protein [Candidatus Omnitrophota bacterium]
MPLTGIGAGHFKGVVTGTLAETEVSGGTCQYVAGFSDDSGLKQALGRGYRCKVQ